MASRRKMMLHMSSGRNGYAIRGETKMEVEAQSSNVGHDATCNGCDKQIFGPRYKCTCCVNFDFCSKCMDKYDEEVEGLRSQRMPRKILTALHSESSHVFARICKVVNRNSPPQLQNRSQWRHEGVKCSNCPSTSGDIVGYRYFCTNCAVSLCESCELAGAHRLDHNLLKMVPQHIANDPLWKDLQP